jgi:hypothetical protein
MTPSCQNTLAQFERAKQIKPLLGDADTALNDLLNTLSTVVQTPLKKDPHAAHRRAHRVGQPAKIEADSELRAFIAARVDTLAFDQISEEVGENFIPQRRVSRSSIHRWWQKTRTNGPGAIANYQL